MLKALFLDMDETLCDTTAANNTAKRLLAKAAALSYGIDGEQFADAYVNGIYRLWSDEQRVRYQPIIDQQSEGAFRLQLIKDVLVSQDVTHVDDTDALILQEKFDADRLQAFEFYPGIADFLSEMRPHLKLVVITNGPEFSQIPKVEKVGLAAKVDHIIIGGQEPEQKPAASIFNKAMTLVGCQAEEVIHIGDSLAADIKGAHNSGIASIWVKHKQVLPDDLGFSPSHCVAEPWDIADLVRSLCQ